MRVTLPTALALSTLFAFPAMEALADDDNAGKTLDHHEATHL